MIHPETTAAQRAQVYYDSPDADTFYYHVWGGEDIHIGLYSSPKISIREASRRTIERMAAQLTKIPSGARLLDIGSGYGGSARYLARHHGLHVTCLNLSTVQNVRNRKANQECGMETSIEVVDGNFENPPFANAFFDVVWSQDAILHSANRLKVFAEVNRILKPGGHFIFTDPMQTESADPKQLRPVLDRIHLESLGSITFYRDAAARMGWSEIDMVDLSPNLPVHYARIKEELERREEELAALCSGAYREKMKTGLQHWINAGRQGALRWGLLHFRKTAGTN